MSRKIMFINPILYGDMNTHVWRSRVMETILGKPTASMLQLVGMILAALTPSEYIFEYHDELLGKVDYESDADMVVITAMTCQIYRAYEISGEFRKRGKTVVIGGIHASVLPDEVLPHCDALIKGECENTWPALMKDYENGCLKKVYDAKEYPPVEHLLSPRVDIIDPRQYLLLPIQATRGCPYECEFCSIRHSSGSRYRMKPVAQVVDEIKAYEALNGGKAYEKTYYFVDDNLYVNREYVKELLNALAPLKIHWHAQGSANVANDDEILQLMAKSGCLSFYIGFESVVEESLVEMNKPKANKVGEYKTMIHNIAQKGIVPGGYFMFGFDGDDISVFRRTYSFIEETELVSPLLVLMTPYPGTKLYERIKDRIFNFSSFLYNSTMCVFTPKNMTVPQLRSGIFWVWRRLRKFAFVKRQLQKFWNLGPWEQLPTLTLKERAVLVAIGLKLGFAGMWGCMGFSFWSAFNKKAANLPTIIHMMHNYESTKQVPDALYPE